MATLTRGLFCLVFLGLLEGPAVATPGQGGDDGAVANDGWTARSPRDEIRPAFEYRPGGGPEGRVGLVIQADRREGLMGWWEKAFPVRGGSYYEFRARRKVEGVKTPRRTTIARILWSDAQGRP